MIQNPLNILRKSVLLFLKFIVFICDGIFKINNYIEDFKKNPKKLKC